MSIMYTTTPLTSSDITPPSIGLGETLIILQRAVSAQGQPGKTLNESNTQDVESSAQEILQKLSSQIGKDKMATVDILVTASDPSIGIEKLVQNRSKSNILTANVILEKIKNDYDKYGLLSGNIKNNSASHEQSVVEISEVKAYREFTDSPGLYEFFSMKALETGQSTFTLYQQQTYKDERDRIGIEDAESMGKRLEQFLSFTRVSTNYHQHNPGRRLVLWAVSNFDTITPLMERIAKYPSDCSELIPVDNLGGITLSIDTKRVGRVHMLGKEYPIIINYEAVTG